MCYGCVYPTPCCSFWQVWLTLRMYPCPPYSRPLNCTGFSYFADFWLCQLEFSGELHSGQCVELLVIFTGGIGRKHLQSFLAGLEQGWGGFGCRSWQMCWLSPDKIHSMTWIVNSWNSGHTNIRNIRNTLEVNIAKCWSICTCVQLP